MEEEKQGKHWYVIHTYLATKIKYAQTWNEKFILGYGKWNFRIEIPTEKEVEITSDGKKKVVEHKVFPGYVLVEMIVNERNWYAVRNTAGVTGFVGSDSTIRLRLQLKK